MNDLIIFGPPGSGKGTQSQKLAKQKGLLHISTGELLRKEIEGKTPLGILADSYISKGHLIPDDLMIDILANELDKPEAANGVLLDGFPRTIAQAEALEKMLNKRGRKLKGVIGLEVPDDELRQRLINRGLVSGRSDDNPEAIEERLKVYHATTKPVVDYFDSKKIYIPINGEGGVDEIFDRIQKRLDN